MVKGTTEVRAVLAAFDGRRVGLLRQLADEDLPAASREAVFDALSGPDQIALTWISKRWAEQGRLAAGEAERVFAALGDMDAPDAILHVLQIAQYCPEAAKSVLGVIRGYADHKRILIRVWAMDAMVRCTAPEEARALISKALSDPSAAMRARARGLQDQGFGTH